MLSDFKALNCDDCKNGFSSSISIVRPKPMDPALNEDEFSAFYCGRCEQHLLKVSEQDFKNDDIGYECPCGTRGAYTLPITKLQCLIPMFPCLTEKLSKR